MLLAFSGCHTITLGPFVFSKRKEEIITQEVRNHETCHAVQWTEMTVCAGTVVLLLQIIYGISPLWYLMSGTAYYIWYVLEYLVRLAIGRDTEWAYRTVGFEAEAYANDDDPDYIENRGLMDWIRYL